MSIIILIILTSCYNYHIVREGDSDYPIISPFPRKNLQRIVLYFPDANVNFLLPEIREVESIDDEIEKIVIRELLKGTKESTLTSLIPQETKLLSLDVVGGIAYVNFSQELVERNYGEKEEALVIYSIVNTLNSLENVEKTQILINGEYKDIFSNYYNISLPIDTSQVIINKKYLSPIETISEFYNSLIVKDYVKAAEFISLSDIGRINFSTVRSYLQNYYSDLIDFNIVDYEINKYNKEVKVKMKYELTYSSLAKNYHYTTFTLIYTGGEFKINKF